MNFRVVGSIVLLASATIPCCAQTYPQSQQPYPQYQTAPRRVDPSTRRDQLAEVNRKLADPDPDVRVSYMESLVATGDTTLIQKAINVAMRSDDATLHNMALRAFMASTREVTFTVAYPSALQARIDAAQMDAEAKKSLEQSVPWLGEVQSLSGSIHLGIFKYAFSTNAGGWSWNENRNDWGKWAPADGGFTIAGDHLTGVAGWGRHKCNIVVHATLNLVLQGTMACGGSLPTLTIYAPMQ